MLFLIGYIVCGFAAFILYNIIGILHLRDDLSVQIVSVVCWPLAMFIYLYELIVVIARVYPNKKARKLAMEQQMIKDFMEM